MTEKRRPYYERLLESECSKTSTKCKGCQKEYLSTTILEHVSHKQTCKDAYLEEELVLMKEKSKLRKWANMKAWLDRNKNDQSQKNAKRYREQKESLKTTEELSEYEKIRLANIEENKALLQEFKSKNKL